MRHPRLPAFLAVLCFVTAWFLPAEESSVTLLDGTLPGYEAFRVAIGPITMYRLAELDLVTIRELLFALSALSNVLVPFAAVAVIRWPRQTWPGMQRLSLAAAVALVLNMQWMWPRGGEYLHLRAGYWLWCSSFLFLALALRRLDTVATGILGGRGSAPGGGSGHPEQRRDVQGVGQT